jgi:pimeloyl-ACP methyl ester carboxylesterase
VSAALRPFQRLPFQRLAERPPRPHPYFDSTAREVETESAQLGRLKIHYREFGAGPPLLLIHGLMTTSYSWRYVLEGLGARFRLIVPDLPGAGRSDKPQVRLGAASLAAWIGEFQQALGVRGCAAVGNSLGGYLCMRHALADEGAFSRLVNIHSPAFPIARLHALNWALAVPGTGRLLSWWIQRAPLEWVYKNVHYYDETLKSLEEAREYAEPLRSVDGVRAFVSYLRDVMAPRSFAEFVGALERRRAEKRAFPMPLLLVYSREDPLVPPATGERLGALVPDARLEWLERTSHFAHVDSPERVVPIVEEFFGG